MSEKQQFGTSDCHMWNLTPKLVTGECWPWERVASPQATRTDEHSYVDCEVRNCPICAAIESGASDAQPAAGTTPPNHELIAQLYSLVGEHEEGCSAVRHITHGDAQKCLAGDHSECESFPSAGTTPQAERPQDRREIIRSHPDFPQMVEAVNKHFPAGRANSGYAIEAIYDFVTARAVAPVETPTLTIGEPCPTCGRTVLPTMGDGDYSCVACGMGMQEPCEHWKAMLNRAETEEVAPVETRLTAELDAMVRDFCAVGPRPKSEVRRRIREFAEAFHERGKDGKS